MGTAHVLLHKIFLNSLHNYKDQVTVLDTVPFDDEDFYNVLVQSPLLTDGYNGQQEMFIKDGKIGFRRDTDT